MKTSPLISLILAITFGLTPFSTFAQTPKTEKPAVQVCVDSRVELMSLIFYLAQNNEYNQCRVRAYIRDVDKQFLPFRQHAVVYLAQRLRNTRGIGFDAPMSLAVRIPPVEQWAQQPPAKNVIFDGLDNRWQRDDVKEFLDKAAQFVQETKFLEFYQSHKEMYDQGIGSANEVLAQAHLEWFDTFFGARPTNHFIVVLGMINGPSNYGTKCPKNGGEELYSIMGVYVTTLTGAPSFHARQLPTVVHEFGHSYVNPLVYTHEKELAKPGKALFDTVQSQMKRMAYGNWITMTHESVNRAAVVRYVAATQGEKAAESEARAQVQNGFAWVPALADSMKQYETQRSTYPTFDAYFPKIIETFDIYATTHKSP